MSFEKARKFIASRQRPARAQVVGDRGPFAKGRLVVETRDVDPTTGAKGEWATRVDDPNLVVTQSQNLMAEMAAGTANAPLNYIELGDPVSPTAPTLADTDLEQTTGERMAVVITTAANVLTAVATWTTVDGNGFTYTESGLFTGPFAGGSMFARKTFAGITKTVAFEMRFSWYITFLINTSGGDCTGIGFVGPGSVTAYTFYTAVGAEASVAATFDFTVGANHVDVFLNGARLYPGDEYNEAGAPLNAPIGGPALNKGVNFVGFTLIAADRVLLIQRTIP